MRDAMATQNWVRRLSDNDEDGGRSFKRARVNGLVDGNPPFRASKLREAGRGNACNVNWGIARSYLESGAGAFYDLYSEAPGFQSIETSFGQDLKRIDYGRVMSEEADRILEEDPSWDYEMQLSIWNMVLHGCGPLFFEDRYRILPRAVSCGNLKVPEFTPANTQYWDAGCLIIDYYPPQLYEFIADAEAATAIGWDVPYTKVVIENAMDLKTDQGIRRDWEFVQQELKNNSLNYMWDDSKINRLAYVFWREFDGTITQCIVERESTTGGAPRQINATKPLPETVRYLFFSRGRFNAWNEAVHPMYFDRGNGGYHHSVTGLGVKMYSAMEHQNRLICNLVDKANAPKTLFKPTSTEATQRFSLSHHGDYGILAPGYDAVQNPIAGMLNEGLEMNQVITQVMQGNLASYKQSVPTKQEGNPVTARQIMLDAQQQSSVSKTTYNRYYKQLDLLYTEIARRMFDLNSTDARAQRCQRRCVERGVPRECFGRIERVRAVRVIGQGSTFMRKVAVDSLMQYAGSLPEDGRENLLSDKIAVEAGQAAVGRYFPKNNKQKLPDEQTAEAMLQVAAMKIGVRPVITSQQNPVTFAGVFMNSAIQAINSVKQGGDITQVLAFLQLDGPAAGAHLQRFAGDPTRQQLHEEMVKHWKRLMQMTDKLKAMAQRQMQQRKAQQQQSAAMLNDIQLKNMKARSDMAIKQAKARQQLSLHAERHRQDMATTNARTQQDMALADATTASDIHRQNLTAFSEGAE